MTSALVKKLVCYSFSTSALVSEKIGKVARTDKQIKSSCLYKRPDKTCPIKTSHIKLIRLYGSSANVDFHRRLESMHQNCDREWL